MRKQNALGFFGAMVVAAMLILAQGCGNGYSGGGAYPNPNGGMPNPGTTMHPSPHPTY
jgi:hypothetical protein